MATLLDVIEKFIFWREWKTTCFTLRTITFLLFFFLHLFQLCLSYFFLLSFSFLLRGFYHVQNIFFNSFNLRSFLLLLFALFVFIITLILFIFAFIVFLLLILNQRHKNIIIRWIFTFGLLFGRFSLLLFLILFFLAFFRFNIFFFLRVTFCLFLGIFFFFINLSLFCINFLFFFLFLIVHSLIICSFIFLFSESFLFSWLWCKILRLLFFLLGYLLNFLSREHDLLLQKFNILLMNLWFFMIQKLILRFKRFLAYWTVKFRNLFLIFINMMLFFSRSVILFVIIFNLSESFLLKCLFNFFHTFFLSFFLLYFFCFVFFFSFLFISHVSQMLLES